MLKTILSQIVSSLKSNGVSEAYTVFDAIPVSRKGEIYTVASVEGFESTAPIYSDLRIFLPFKAEAGISVIAPVSAGMAELYDYFDSFILPIIEQMGSLTASLKSVSMKKDSNINRLVLKANLSVSGICQLERSDL